MAAKPCLKPTVPAVKKSILFQRQVPADSSPLTNAKAAAGPLSLLSFRFNFLARLLPTQSGNDQLVTADVQERQSSTGSKASRQPAEAAV